MDLIGDGAAITRRRGTALEDAILAAAWEQLVETGYGGFSYEAIAERARTSKPVLYRRWPTREALLLAALRHHGEREDVHLPDTGNLRDDVVALLHDAQDRRAEMFAFLSAHLGGLYREARLSPAALRASLIGERPDTMTQLIRRAIERGEITGARLTPRVITLAFDLYRNEAFMTFELVPDDVIEEIVDTVFMPLVRHLDEPAG